MVAPHTGTGTGSILLRAAAQQACRRTLTVPTTAMSNGAVPSEPVMGSAPVLAGEPPRASHPEADQFYAESLQILKDSGIPFLVAGTFAINCYTGIDRPTKDLDIFCKAGDFPRILLHFQELGFETEIEDERWIAKVKRGPYFFDVIFSSGVAIVPISDAWFQESHPATYYGIEVQLTPPTELIWSKALLQLRHRYDGADVAHMILKQSDRIDWKRLLNHMEQYWEVLLIHVLNFRFVYPTERENVPRWLYDELLQRAQQHADLPVPKTKVCRGRLFSPIDYEIDVTRWGFADIIGAPAPVVETAEKDKSA